MADEAGTSSLPGVDAMIWNWTRSNIPTIIAIGGLLWYQAANDATMKAKMDEGDRYRASRSAFIDSKLDALQDNPLRIKALEEQVHAANDRADRMLELVQSNQAAVNNQMQQGFDQVRKDISSLSSNVAVINSKLQTTVPGRPQDGAYRMPRG